jgi:hypothetical protein
MGFPAHALEAGRAYPPAVFLVVDLSMPERAMAACVPAAAVDSGSMM